MKCPKCNHPKTKDDFYYKKGTENKAHPNCKDCVCKERHERLVEIKPTGNYFNLKEFAKYYAY